MNKKLSERCGKVIGVLAKKAAVRDANTGCQFLAYQSRLPASVKKLRKF